MGKVKTKEDMYDKVQIKMWAILEDQCFAVQSKWLSKKVEDLM